jgi:hypothetical protein
MTLRSDRGRIGRCPGRAATNDHAAGPPLLRARVPPSAKLLTLWRVAHRARSRRSAWRSRWFGSPRKSRRSGCSAGSPGWQFGRSAQVRGGVVFLFMKAAAEHYGSALATASPMATALSAVHCTWASIAVEAWPAYTRWRAPASLVKKMCNHATSSVRPGKPGRGWPTGRDAWCLAVQASSRAWAPCRRPCTDPSIRNVW